MELFSRLGRKIRKDPMLEHKRVAEAESPLVTFEDELTRLISKYGLDSLTNTPDFILAYYLKDCALTYQNLATRRTEWFKQKQAKDETDRASHLAPLG